jgi:uncharacterized zinc-type alcohol dehydrogenase-like protein
MTTVRAYAAREPKGKLEPFAYELGPLDPEGVEIEVEYCGICHSDLSMLNNDWGMTEYPFVPGHEVVGRVAAIGSQVTSLQVGQRVGLGWFSQSCRTCEWCISGEQNLCASAEGTIVGRHGGFADRVRAHRDWVFPLPEGLDPETSGPLFCGGITVFNPIVQCGVKASDRVGIIGIGGLGHMAIQFFRAWGCDVTAFSSSADKEAEAREMGANHFVNSRDPEAIAAVANSYDLILSTVNVDLDWAAYIDALRPKGRLHLVGAVLNPLSIPVFPLLVGQKTISSSPVGNPHSIAQMLDIAARHAVNPIVEMFPLEQVNEAIAKLEKGQPRYRLVLKC